jgi:hypothetical protein
MEDVLLAVPSVLAYLQTIDLLVAGAGQTAADRDLPAERARSGGGVRASGVVGSKIDFNRPLQLWTPIPGETQVASAKASTVSGSSVLTGASRGQFAASMKGYSCLGRRSGAPDQRRLRRRRFAARWRGR